MNKVSFSFFGIFAAVLLLISGCCPKKTDLKLVASENNGNITLPDGFSAVVVADDLKGVRGLAVAPNGDLYARVRGRGIVALRDTNGDGVADEVTTIPESTGDGSGIGIHGGYLYYTTKDAVYRYKREPGQLIPVGKPEPIVSGLLSKGTHDTKMLAFDGDGMLYVEVGSPANALGNPDRQLGSKGFSDEVVEAALKIHGAFFKFDPAKAPFTFEEGEQIDKGHRHIISVAWHPTSGELFGLQNGRDVLDVVKPSAFDSDYNATRVAEEFHILKKGSNLGWPYTFYDPIDMKRKFSPEYGGDGTNSPEEGRFQDPLIALPAHWAPMQMTYYESGQFPAEYNKGMFVTFHGSWNRWPDQKGYNLVHIPFGADGMPTGDYEVFADGFMGAENIENPNDAAYRPFGVAQAPDGSLYVGADHGGRIWRIWHSGK